MGRKPSQDTIELAGPPISTASMIARFALQQHGYLIEALKDSENKERIATIFSRLREILRGRPTPAADYEDYADGTFRLVVKAHDPNAINNSDIMRAVRRAFIEISDGPVSCGGKWYTNAHGAAYDLASQLELSCDRVEGMPSVFPKRGPHTPIAHIIEKHEVALEVYEKLYTLIAFEEHRARKRGARILITRYEGFDDVVVSCDFDSDAPKHEKVRLPKDTFLSIRNCATELAIPDEYFEVFERRVQRYHDKYRGDSTFVRELANRSKNQPQFEFNVGRIEHCAKGLTGT